MVLLQVTSTGSSWQCTPGLSSCRLARWCWWCWPSWNQKRGHPLPCLTSASEATDSNPCSLQAFRRTTLWRKAQKLSWNSINITRFANFLPPGLYRANIQTIWQRKCIMPFQSVERGTKTQIKSTLFALWWLSNQLIRMPNSLSLKVLQEWTQFWNMSLGLIF